MTKFTKSKQDVEKMKDLDKKEEGEKGEKTEMIEESEEYEHMKEDLYEQFSTSYCKTVEKMNCLEGVLFNYGRISVQYPESRYLRSIIKNVAKLVVVEGIRAEEQLHRIYEDENIKGLELSFLNNVDGSLFRKTLVQNIFITDGECIRIFREMEISTIGLNPTRWSEMDPFGNHQKRGSSRNMEPT